MVKISSGLALLDRACHQSFGGGTESQRKVKRGRRTEKGRGVEVNLFYLFIKAQIGCTAAQLQGVIHQSPLVLARCSKCALTAVSRLFKGSGHCDAVDYPFKTLWGHFAILFFFLNQWSRLLLAIKVSCSGNLLHVNYGEPWCGSGIHQWHLHSGWMLGCWQGVGSHG